MHVAGVTFVGDKSTAQGPAHLLRVLAKSSGSCSNCRFVMNVENTGATMIEVSYGSTFSTRTYYLQTSNLVFEGNGTRLAAFIHLTPSSTFQAAFLDVGQISNYYFSNAIIQYSSFISSNLSVMLWSGSPQVSIINSGVTGSKHSVSTNSILSMGGLVPPGSIAGVEATGGVYIP